MKQSVALQKKHKAIKEERMVKARMDVGRDGK